MRRLFVILLFALAAPAALAQAVASAASSTVAGAVSGAVPGVVSQAQAPLQAEPALGSTLSLAPGSMARPAMQDPVSFAMLGQLLMGLVIVIMAILLVLWLVKRFTGLGVQGHHLKIVAALSLGTREKAVLIEVGGRQLLLGVAPGRVSLLERFDEPVVETDPGAGFGARLREVLERKERQ
ncbi:flagellar biosynthetic protein FliO [Marinobacterium aestuarii]|uniref:Flagellar protein n=1 Tax=Marinobacterium aestuarii TaxID=1821621 RepID=A0A1A9EV23_9GAMM|nr:flagellar biosynthetic protein FliO [Marinobacterium aestuarii]ANG61756.1 flagellar biosynthetic protein FliO [Marinobacterium aestuarii]